MCISRDVEIVTIHAFRDVTYDRPSSRALGQDVEETDELKDKWGAPGADPTDKSGDSHHNYHHNYQTERGGIVLNGYCV